MLPTLRNIAFKQNIEIASVNQTGKPKTSPISAAALVANPIIAVDFEYSLVTFNLTPFKGINFEIKTSRLL